MRGVEPVPTTVYSVAFFTVNVLRPALHKKEQGEKKVLVLQNKYVSYLILTLTRTVFMIKGILRSLINSSVIRTVGMYTVQVLTLENSMMTKGYHHILILLISRPLT